VHQFYILERDSTMFHTFGHTVGSRVGRTIAHRKASEYIDVSIASCDVDIASYNANRRSYEYAGSVAWVDKL